MGMLSSFHHFTLYLSVELGVIFIKIFLKGLVRTTAYCM